MTQWNGPFIILVFKSWRFRDQFQSLIYNFLNSVIFNLLLNGSVFEKIKPSCDLRQGNPLSLLFFIIGSEILSRLLGKEETYRRLHGMKVDRNASTIAHLMYTEYLLVTIRADKQEAESFRKCFDYYCIWSGREANLDKSNIYFSKCTKGIDKKIFFGSYKFQRNGSYISLLWQCYHFGKKLNKRIRSPQIESAKET